MSVLACDHIGCLQPAITSVTLRSVSAFFGDGHPVGAEISLCDEHLSVETLASLIAPWHATLARGSRLSGVIRDALEMAEPE